jgi:tetratricopeptide (TPR) repeat protein
LQAPQLKPIQDLIPFLNNIKEVNQNITIIQSHLTKDEMEKASKIIHITLDLLYNTFLLSSAVLRERRKLQFQIYLAKMMANLEFLAAICHTDMAELNQAITHFSQSAIYSTIADKQKNIVISNYLKSLSLIYNKQYEEALRHFEITQSLSEQYKIPRYKIMGLGGMAIAKFLLGNLEQAKEIMNTVHQLIENDEEEALLVMNEFGDNFYMMGRPDVAIHLYNEAFEIALNLKRITIADSIHSKIKRSYYATGSFNNAQITVQLQKILDLAYILKNGDNIALYQQKLAQLEKINESIKAPLPFALNIKWISGENMPAPLKEEMDLMHIAKEQKEFKGTKQIQFTNFFCFNAHLGNLVIQIPEEASLRFERVPEAYKLALKTNEERYSIIEASDQEKQKYSIRFIIVTKSMDNIIIRRVTPYVFGKFLES